MVSNSSALAMCSRMIWGIQSCLHERVGDERGRREGGESRRLGSDRSLNLARLTPWRYSLYHLSLSVHPENLRYAHVMGPAREIRKAAKRLSLADARGFANLAKAKEGFLPYIVTHSRYESQVTVAGLEPTILGSEDQRLTKVTRDTASCGFFLNPRGLATNGS